MTPEEKAKELIDKYWMIEDCDDHQYQEGYVCSHQAKQCAIICVEQIIEAAKNIDNNLDEWEGVRMHPEIYWEEVLSHIKNS